MTFSLSSAIINLMPEDNQPAKTPENKTSVLDKNVPNPLAKNPNVHTHKVFATVGLILIGLIISLAFVVVGIWGYFNPNITPEPESTVKVSTSSAKKSTDSAEKTDLTTYKSETFKYSIDYPKTYTIKTNYGNYDDDKTKPHGEVRLNAQETGTKFIQGKNGIIIYETFEGGFCEYSGENVEKCKVEELNVSGQIIKKYTYPADQAKTYPDGQTYAYTTTYRNNAIVIFTNFDADQFIKTMTFF